MSEYRLEPLEDDDQYALNNWVEKKNERFLYAVGDILKNPKFFHDEIASAIAWEYFQNEEGCESFLATYGLDETHIMCYLYTQKDRYFQEVQELYFNSMIDD